jgi:hypothetical protein
MTAVVRYDVWRDTNNVTVAQAVNGRLVVQSPQQDFASFGSTVAVNLGNTTPVKITYDRALYAASNMTWAFGTPVSGVPAHNWTHTQTGFYQLTFWARATNDVWRVMSVCRNDSSANAVGTSARTGSSTGWGYAAELIYRVDSVSDTFALFGWSASASSAMSAFSGTPPAGFIAPPQAGGVAPADGYFITFNISRLSPL